MSAPFFLHVYANGDLWVSNDINFTPTTTQESGTLLGTFRINSDAKPQKISSLAGTAGSNLTATNKTGKFGTEIV